MASSYPGSLDSFTNPSSTDAMDASAALYHDTQHANANDAIEAVQAELGTDPAGGAATVKARLANLSFAEPAAHHWASGAYSSNAAGTSNSTTTTPGAADTLYLVPWWCHASVTLDRISVEVSTGQTGATARLGIYSSDANNAPGSLLLDGGEISAATTGWKELTINQAVTGDTLYYLAILNSTASVAYTCLSTLATRSTGVPAPASGSGLYNRIQVTRTYSSGLAATADAWSSFTQQINAPYFKLRRT